MTGERLRVWVKWKLVVQLFWYRLLMQMGLKGEEIYYIGGSEALPPPLSREEEEHLLERLPGGDAAVRAMLIERNLRLVVYIARKFENTGIHIEDLVSIGTIGLIKAVNTFDPGKRSNWLPMLHDALRMRFSCFCGVTTRSVRKYPSTNL